MKTRRVRTLIEIINRGTEKTVKTRLKGRHSQVSFNSDSRLAVRVLNSIN